MVPTLPGVSLVMFCRTLLIPGHPSLLRWGNFATAEQLRQMGEEMGLNKPPLERDRLYLTGGGTGHHCMLGGSRPPRPLVCPI
jgi:peptide/nickel transport system permease protein